MAENYHSFFMEKKGSGEDKEAALESFKNWMGLLHPGCKNPWIILLQAGHCR